MEVIYPPKMHIKHDEELKLFMAGGISDCPPWQDELITLLESEDPPLDLQVFNPRWKDFSKESNKLGWTMFEQINWEFERLKVSDAISFWFSRGSLNPIALYEYGKWAMSTDIPVFVGVDPEYERIPDVAIQTKLARSDINVVHSLDDLSCQIVDWVKK